MTRSDEVDDMAFLVSKQEVEYYDVSMPDWPGEIDFYHSLIRGTQTASQPGARLLEIACGTGRVALQLAREGITVVGMDFSDDMLEAARQKSAGMPNVSWAQGDMRSFQLDGQFDWVIIPGHSFQYMLTPQDQLDCLLCIRGHLKPGGLLVVHLDHQNVAWLGDLIRQPDLQYHPSGEYTRIDGAGLIRRWTAWRYEPGTQTATAYNVWETVGAQENVVERVETQPKPMHCVFRFEMDHLLARAGFDQAQVYGDFFRHELADDSPQMIWMAQRSSQAAS